MDRYLIYATRFAMDSPLKCHVLRRVALNYCDSWSKNVAACEKQVLNTYRNRLLAAIFHCVRLPNDSAWDLGGEILMLTNFAKQERKYNPLQMPAMARNTLGLPSQ